MRTFSIAKKFNSKLEVRAAYPTWLAARRNRFQIIRVVIAAGADPPSTGNHGDEAVVRMRMRLAVVMRFPFVQHHIKPRFGRVADQYR